MANLAPANNEYSEPYKHRRSLDKDFLFDDVSPKYSDTSAPSPNKLETSIRLHVPVYMF